MISSDQHSDHRLKLKKLQEDYLKKLPGYLSRLENLIRDVPLTGAFRDNRDAESLMRYHLDLIYGEAHKLTGSTGSFGLREAAQAAKTMVDVIDTWFDSPAISALEKRDELLSLVNTMRNARPVDAPDSPPPLLKHSHKIHIVDDDEAIARQLLLWLTEAGFDAEIFMSAAIYCDTFPILPRPDLIIMDIQFGREDSAGTQVIRHLKRSVGSLPPVAFVSSRDDIEARLESFRAGASRYLKKPVAQQDLLALAAEYADQKDAGNYRILLVDDDEEALHVNQLWFEEAGCTVCAISNALDAFHAARAFEPDVILLDVFMPGATGTEIAAVFREERAFDVVPILFLTIDTHPDLKVMGAALGGDDFINKPFDPDYLLTTVIARARRSRRLRNLINPAPVPPGS